MKLFEKLLFAITIVVSFIGALGFTPLIITVFLLISCCIYLFTGWLLLYPDKGKVFAILPFWVAYLIAQTIIVIIFGINSWPLKNFFSILTFFTLLATMIGLLFANKKLTSEFPVKKYQLRLFVCWMISGMPLYMHILD